MARTRANPGIAATAHPATADPFAWLTHVAFILLLGVVIARATAPEWSATASSSLGAGLAARPPGPTASVALDLLCCVPALLVLVRRVIDRTYVLRWSWSFVPLGVLSAWMLASRFWAADRFAATVASLNFVSTVAMLWAAVQLVRSWLRLRMVAATLLGILLIYGAWGVFYQWLDVPDLQKFWQENKTEILQQHNLQPGSFGAIQLERNITNAAMLGFSTSPNSYAAATVLMLLVALGLLVQRWKEQSPQDGTLYLLLLAAAFAGGWILFYTHSRAAAASLVLGLLILVALVWLRPLLARHWRKAFVATLGLIVLGATAGIAHGLYHGGFGTIASSSLTFRWQYWVGAARLVEKHPLLGVGWSNFGYHYLQTRLPQASEEIKDPHNFIMRFAAELGLTGAALLTAWLLRLWWEFSRPTTPAEAAPPAGAKPPRPLVSFSLIAIAGIFINVLVSVDFATDPAYVLFELLKRLMFLGMLLIGSVLAGVKSVQEPEADPRPAPWVLYGAIVALGMFLVHNLIDFAMFETGVLGLFMLLAGSVLGVRLPSVAGRRKQDRAAQAGLAIAAIASLALAIFLLIPLAGAERRAALADDLMRSGRPREADALFRDAHNTIPTNASYAYRAAQAAMAAQLPAGEVRARLARAISANPLNERYYIDRAGFEAAQPSPDRQQVLSDLDAALKLNPYDVATRLIYADTLAAYGMNAEAREAYQRALDDDDRLEKANPKRLPPEQVQQIRRKIAAM